MKHKPYSEMEQKVTLCMDNAYEIYDELVSRGKYMIADEMYVAVRAFESSANLSSAVG